MIKLLTLKHWQLFVLLMGLPLIFQLVATGALLTDRNPSIFFIAFAVMMILFAGLFFGWFYAIATNLHKKLPSTAPMNLKKFKIFLSIPVTYILFLILLSIVVVTNEGLGENINPMYILLIIPFHLFSIFSIMYCLYFTARLLKTVESQRPLRFSDFAGEFFLMWFFPIGVWFIQPRLNKLAGSNDYHDTDQALDTLIP